MRRCFGYGQFTGLNQTTYQDEIAKTPFIHRTGENNFMALTLPNL